MENQTEWWKQQERPKKLLVEGVCSKAKSFFIFYSGKMKQSFWVLRSVSMKVSSVDTRCAHVCDSMCVLVFVCYTCNHTDRSQGSSLITGVCVYRKEACSRLVAVHGDGAAWQSIFVCDIWAGYSYQRGLNWVLHIWLDCSSVGVACCWPPTTPPSPVLLDQVEEMWIN